jgi:hypothetical protein
MAKKTRAELSTEAVTTNLPDNNQELITPATERTQLASERESTLNYKDDLSGITPGHILTVGGDNESIDFIDNTIPTSGQVTEWDDAYDKRIDSLTTTGTSGAATLAANVLNIPEYGTGDVKKTGTITAEQAAFWNDSTDTLRSEAAFYKSGGNFVITTNLSAIGGRSLSAQFLNLYDNPYLRIQAQASGTVAFNSLDLNITAGNPAKIRSSIGTGGAYQNIEIETGGSNTMIIKTDHGVDVVGTLDVGAAATFSGQINANNGISFPTPSPASSGTVASSVLDAYEEGTWTPIMNQGGANVTANAANGIYTRVGNLLHIGFYFYSNTPNSLSGSWVVKGLPYNLKSNQTNAYPFINFGYNSINGTDYSFTESGRGQVNTTSALDVYASWYNTSFTIYSLELSGSGTLLIA